MYVFSLFVFEFKKKISSKTFGPSCVYRTVLSNRIGEALNSVSGLCWEQWGDLYATRQLL
jgi:hypothetical protein